MEKEISKQKQALWRQNFEAGRANHIAMNAASRAGLKGAAISPAASVQLPMAFSIDLEQGEATDQENSGRCWMFAALNTMRYRVIKKYKLKDFKLSPNYTLFYDKLEKANYFLEAILDTTDQDLDSRLLAYLLQAPMGDGGQWDMLVSLVDKYGVVPESAMPETKNSRSTYELAHYLEKLLRKDAYLLRQAAQAGKKHEELEKEKEGMMEEVYRILTIALGQPPLSFEFGLWDKEHENYYHEEAISPQDFFKKYVAMDIDHYWSLINAPTKDKPFHKTFTVQYLGNVVGGRPVHYLNLPIEELKAAAVRQLQAGQPVWFGSDVGQAENSAQGYLDLDSLEVGKLVDVDFSMDKAVSLDYGDSMMTHAMTITGVQLDADGKPSRWKVENSWGKDFGHEGYFVMSDDWFSRFVYQIVVHEDFLTDQQKEELKQPAIELKPWDPMGSLAR